MRASSSIAAVSTAEDLQRSARDADSSLLDICSLDLIALDDIGSSTLTRSGNNQC